jgi:ribose transport system substrate-binding protein
MQAELAKRCPSCKTTVIDVPAADWGTKMQSSVQSALLKDPGVNYVIPLYDSASQFVVPAILSAGRPGKVKIASYNGTPFVLQMIQQNKGVGMDVAESLQWIAYANMDQALRLMVAGCFTNQCVEATVRDAHARDLDVVLVSDGVAAFDPALHDASMQSLRPLSTQLASAEVVRMLGARPGGGQG